MIMIMMMQHCKTSSHKSLSPPPEFLVGDDLLVVPVVTANASTLQVVVPPGEWQQAGTGLAAAGPTTLTLTDITLDTIVYFTRKAA